MYVSDSLLYVNCLVIPCLMSCMRKEKERKNKDDCNVAIGVNYSVASFSS